MSALSGNRMPNETSNGVPLRSIEVTDAVRHPNTRANMANAPNSISSTSIA